MTTIAFDGRFLAADRRVTQNAEITTWACQKLDVAGDPPTAFASTGMIIESSSTSTDLPRASGTGAPPRPRYCRAGRQRKGVAA